MIKWKNFTKKVLMTTLVAALAVGGFTGCGKTSADKEAKDTAKSQTAAASGELIPIRLGVGGQGNNYSMELANLAYKNGYLEEELKAAGYALELQAFLQTGPEVNAALASGSLDGAIYGDFPVFTSNSNGIGSTVIAVVNSQTQYGILTVRDDIKEPKDLEGKCVIVGQGTVIQYFWEHYAAQNNLDTSTIEIINATDAASLLQTGEADAYVSVMIAAKRMENMGLGKVFDDGSDVTEGSSVGVVTLENKFLAENKAAAVAINKALLKAYDDALATPESFYEALATDTMPVEVQRTGYENDPTLKQLNPQITEQVVAHFESLNQWLLDNSLIQTAVDVGKIYDTSYYEQAVAELGK